MGVVVGVVMGGMFMGMIVRMVMMGIMIVRMCMRHHVVSGMASHGEKRWSGLLPLKTL